MTGEAMVEVRLAGGPADWDGKTLPMPAGQVHGRPRDQVGAYLISAHTPDRAPHEDQDPRAVYEPDLDPAEDVTLWRFRGWFPAAPGDPSPTSP